MSKKRKTVADMVMEQTATDAERVGVEVAFNCCAEETRHLLAQLRRERDRLTDDHMGSEYFGVNCAIQGIELLAKRLGLRLEGADECQSE